MTSRTNHDPLLLLAAAVMVAGLGLFFCAQAVASPDTWKFEWPETDFSTYSVDLDEIKSGGPPKDGIPPIDDPRFVAVSDVDDIAPSEPVIGLNRNGEWKAYPLRILMWHEIVNDEIDGMPVAVTFCPLCNAAIVFDRRVNGRVLDFGTTGKLRRSDLVMWDRQTESWWQQFIGEAIVGEMTGTVLQVVPSRLESFERFKERAPRSAKVLVPTGDVDRPYGSNPYESYDSQSAPWLYDGETPDGIDALERVVSLSDKERAWTVEYLSRVGEITTSDGIRIRWEPGQNSALDTSRIADGKDVGNVIVTKDGKDVPYFVDFAFAFHAFRPDAPIKDVDG